MLDNKIIMIIGGAGLLGSAISKSIIQYGGRLILVDKNSEALESLSLEFGSEHCLAINMDVGKTEKIDLILEKALSKFGRIDSVIHAAYPRSSQWGTKFEDIQQKLMNDDLSCQIGGSILLSQRVLDYFHKQQQGNLIFVSSIQGIRAPKFEHYENTQMISPIEYSASKHALIGITRYLSKYYKGNNIRVNCVSPGGILNGQDQVFQSQYRESCNNKGMLDAEDIVGTFIFLLSDLSKFINGQNIIVDDGWSL